MKDNPINDLKNIKARFIHVPRIIEEKSKWGIFPIITVKWDGVIDEKGFHLKDEDLK